MSESIDEFISVVSLWKPEWLVPSAWLEHAPFAFWLVDKARPRRIVELGTAHGFSYMCMCQAVHRTGLDAECYAVDTWDGDEHAGFYGEDVFLKLKEYNDSNYRSFSKLIRSTFDQAVSHFDDQSIDILHLDGRHFYEDVKEDFERWSPKLSRRAVVLFHDTSVRERDFGVWRYWNELHVDRPGFEFQHGYGL